MYPKRGIFPPQPARDASGDSTVPRSRSMSSRYGLSLHGQLGPFSASASAPAGTLSERVGPTGSVSTSRVAFLLGAGASLPAGIPDTRRLIEALFADVALGEALRRALRGLVDRLESNGLYVDIERLLDAVTRLESSDERQLAAALYENPKAGVEVNGLGLSTAIQDFIRRHVTLRSADAVRYLDPLLDFIALFRPLDVFSVNYDNCIELFCRLYRKSLHTGFTPQWDARSLMSADTDVRLYKLHGSVTWFYSHGRYFENSLSAASQAIDTSTGDVAHPLILYPLRKWQYVGPLWDLVSVLKDRLSSTALRYLVISGYSFRDDPIRQVLWEAAELNPNLYVLLIDPNAEDIYKSRLRLYEDGAPSALDGRVLRLSYLLEGYLPLLKDVVLMLDDGLAKWDEMRDRELRSPRSQHISRGAPMNRAYLDPLTDAEYTDRVQAGLQACGDLPTPDTIKLKGKLAVSLLVSGDDGAQRLLDEVRKILWDAFVDRLHVDVSLGGTSRDHRVSLNIKHDAQGTSSTRMSTSYELVPAIREVVTFAGSRLNALKGDHALRNKIDRLCGSLRKLLEYVETWDMGGMSLERYTRDESNHAFELEYKRLSRQGADQGQSAAALAALIREREWATLKDILAGVP